MLKTYERQFNFLQKLIDAATIASMWNLAYFLRFSILNGHESISSHEFFKYSLVPITLTLYFQSKNKLYESWRFKDRNIEIWNSLKSNIEAGLVLTLILYFIEPIRLSRILLATYIASTLILMPSIRLIQRNLLRYLRKKGYNTRNCLIIGNGAQLQNYVRSLKSLKDTGIVIKKSITDLKQIELFLQSECTFNYDSIIVGFRLDDQKVTDKVIKHFHNENVSIQIIPEFDHAVIGAEVSLFEGTPVISLNQAPISGSNWVLKRIFDICSAGVGLIFISPILLIISILVKLTSKGPIFYGQERMGLDGKKFKMWKFRSMNMARKNEDITTWSSKNNPRITPLGAFLRKTSLDELPQLWNVFVGEMSLVGPRPERPHFVNEFKQEIPDYMLRHRMKAGITGLAQVNGLRGDTCIKTRIDYDIKYIKSWSILLDVKIIFMTFIKGFLNKNAY